MLTDFVVCPACGGELSADPSVERLLHCGSCQRRHAPVGRIACLLPDIDRWLDLWRAQWAVIHEEAKVTLDTFAAELRKPGLLPTTRVRLDAQVALTQRMVAEIDGVLADALGEPQAQGEPIVGYQPLESLHLLHRDWGWPDSDENARALACVERVLCAPLGRVLVIGAGACRLAYDLHTRHAATATVAIDIDPLVFTMAERIVVAGQRVPLTEARSNATELDRLSIVRTLAAPQGPAANFHLLLANGLAPPLREHAFDTVVTPWFIDLVPPDLREFVGVIHRLLVPGGRWLDFGPLLYPLGRPPACRLSREEVFELARRTGFDIERSTSELLPFSLSPLADRGRLEHCLAFSARAVATPADRPGDLPSWIVLPHLPVPDFPGRTLFHHDNAAFRAIIDLVDGQRSIDDIALAITQLTGKHPAALADTIRYCLLDTHPACRGLA